MAFAVFAMYLAQPLTPNFIKDVRNFSLSEVGIVFTLGALGNSLLALLVSRFIRVRVSICTGVCYVVYVDRLVQRKPACYSSRFFFTGRLSCGPSIGNGTGVFLYTIRKWALLTAQWKRSIPSSLLSHRL